MSQMMPDQQESYLDDLTMDQAESWERIGFLQRVYSLVLLGVAIFAATAYAVGHDIGGLGTWVIKTLCSSFWLPIVILLAAAFGVRMIARTPGIGLIGYLAYAVLLGMFIGPAIGMASGNSVTAAAITTLCVFGGLTAYVFITKQDFSWLRGILFTVLFGMLGVAICGMIFGFQIGFLYNLVGALLFSGFILYDTSNVLHRSTKGDEVPAAIELFVDIVMLFWHLLSLFNDD